VDERAPRRHRKLLVRVGVYVDPLVLEVVDPDVARRREVVVLVEEVDVALGQPDGPHESQRLLVLFLDGEVAVALVVVLGFGFFGVEAGELVPLLVVEIDDLDRVVELESAFGLDEEALKAAGGDRSALIQEMITSTVDAMYSESDENRFLEVTYASGDREILFFKDFASGAMIENIVRRAKKDAIKRQIAGSPPGVREGDLITAIKQEFKEHEDLPNTTNPDDWARVSGKKGERIIYVRTLVGGDEESRMIEKVSPGQYL